LTQAQVVTIVTHAIVLVAKVAGPVLIAALAVGLVVSVFQSLTQVNDYTLTFLPKLVVIALIVAVAGHWMLGDIVGFTRQLYESIPSLVTGA
jgi:flagellar biosynthetic protein FliQ